MSQSFNIKKKKEESTIAEREAAFVAQNQIVEKILNRG